MSPNAAGAGFRFQDEAGALSRQGHSWARRLGDSSSAASRPFRSWRICSSADITVVGSSLSHRRILTARLWHLHQIYARETRCKVNGVPLLRMSCRPCGNCIRAPFFGNSPRARACLAHFRWKTQLSRRQRRPDRPGRPILGSSDAFLRRPYARTAAIRPSTPTMLMALRKL